MPQLSGRMNPRERAICERVRQVRSALKWSQPTFAKELGITLPRLKCLEYANTPLPFDLGARICEVFDLSQAWLAIGQLPKYGVMPFSGTFPPRILFSAVYQEHLAQQVEKWEATRAIELERLAKRTPGVQKPNHRFARTAAGRQTANMVLNFSVSEWLLQVPDASLDDFVNAVLAHGQQLIQACPEESLDILQTRLDQRLRQDNEFHRKQRQWTQYLFGPSKGDIDYKKDLILETSSGINESMHSPWQDLRSRLRRLLVKWGAQAALARQLKMSPQLVNAYVLGTASPTADNALCLQKWVRDQEARNQRKSPPSARTLKGQRTQRGESYEKPTSDPNSDKE